MDDVVHTVGGERPAVLHRPGADVLTRRATRRIALAAGVLIALVAAHGAAWAWTVRQLDAGLAQWILLRRAEGWAVSAGQPVPGGWPAAAELLVPGLAVMAEGGAVSWRGDVVLRVTPLDHRRLQVRPVGVQQVQAGDGPPVELAAGLALGLVALDAPDAMDVQAEGVRARLPWGELTLGSLRGRVTREAAALEAEGIGLPAGLGWPLGSMVETVSFEAALSAPVPPDPDPAERARGWRVAGGEVRVRQAAVLWGALDVAGSGTASLDEALQPRAEATLRLKGYDAALDALGGAGLLPGGALAAKTILGLMAQRTTNGAAEVSIPLQLQDGVVRMGQVPLLRLGPLDWKTP